MSTERFPRKQVERAFQKFEDYTDDVFSARFQTWDDRFSRLMCHCEQDPVMRVVTEPLRSNARVNIDEWYEAAKATGGGMIGSGSYKLPADKEDMAALLYKLLLMVHEDKIEIPEFCMHFFGETTF